MAILSNINDKFAVDSSGGIQFSGQTGTSGYVLKSNGNAAPTWVDGSTVIGGPYLPLSGGTLTGATATASGISFTVGGTAVFDGDMTLPAAADHFLIGAGSLQTTSKIKFGLPSWNNSIGLESYWMVLRTNQNEGLKLIDSTETIYVQLNAGNNSAGANYSYFKGRVGIGTNTPTQSKLVVIDSTDTSKQIVFSDNATYYGSISHNAGTGLNEYRTEATGGHAFYKGTETTPKVIINSAGNVGIGTTLPTTALTIRKAIASQTYGEQASMIEFKSYFPAYDTETVKSAIYSGVSSQLASQTSKGFMSFWTSSQKVGGGQNLTEKMRIEADGKVGIGTTSPDDALDITGGYLKFNGGDYGLKGSASLTYNPVSDHYFQASGSTKVTFKASGSVGIGNTSPGAKLDVVMNNSGGATRQDIFRLLQSGQNTLSCYMYGGTTDLVQLHVSGPEQHLSLTTGGVATATTATGIHIRSGGNVGIGTQSATQPLDVNGYSICDKQYQRDQSLAVILGTPRILNIGYKGANGSFDFDPVSLFGSLPQGGQCEIQVTGWQNALNNGIISWRDNGSNTNIGNGVVIYTQIAYIQGAQGLGNISVSTNSGTNIITVSFSQWHGNSHGWNCKVISYQA